MVDYPKAPGIAFPWTIRLGIIELIDPPVITLAEFEKAGGRISSIFLVLADQYVLRIGSAGFVDIVEIVAEVHIVRDREISRSPAKAHPHILIHGTITRGGSQGIRKSFTALHNSLNLGPGQGIVVNADFIEKSVESSLTNIGTITVISDFDLGLDIRTN
ncbi:hypothetical protein ES703_59113 [subsurface metagenome]